MKYNNYTKMSHSLITTTNVIPFRNTTKSQDMKTIKNAMKKDNLQKTELINAIIAAHRQYSKNKSGINLVNSILKKVPSRLISNAEYNNIKNAINNNVNIFNIINHFDESALQYYGI